MSNEDSTMNRQTVSAEGELVLDLSSVNELLKSRIDNVTVFDMSKKVAEDSANAAAKLILNRNADLAENIQIQFTVNSNRIGVACDVTGTDKSVRVQALSCVSAALIFLWDYSISLGTGREMNDHLAGIKNIRIIQKKSQV